jgi:predicted SAM-dependent methyltransferase
MTQNLLKRIIPSRKRYALRQGLRWFNALRFVGNRVHCPCCNRNFSSFIRWDPDDPKDDSSVCPYCALHSRHRLLWLYLREKTGLWDRPLRVLHFAPEYVFWKTFRKQGNLRYVPVDLVSGLADMKLDIRDLPFRSESFDVIICSHVLEHIVDDSHAMGELYRVLKHGGWGVVLVPIDYSSETTVEDVKVVTPVERLMRFGQDDHVRIYGKDFFGRLASAGFTVETVRYVDELGDELRKRYGLMKNEHIFLCRKG